MKSHAAVVSSAFHLDIGFAMHNKLGMRFNGRNVTVLERDRVISVTATSAAVLAFDLKLVTLTTNRFADYVVGELKAVAA